MQTLIEGYRIFPGEHCGSTAMRGLLNHFCDLELPEDVVFGLGAGLECVYLSIPGMNPGAMTFGRSVTMEADLAVALGVDYEEKPEPDDEKAWADVREEVLAGRPTMLSGDIFYLDYREYKVHFPGHRFVLLGFDDEKEVVHIADRIRDEPEVCSYGALFESRNPPDGMSTNNLWGRFLGETVGNDLRTASRLAIDLCAKRMLGEKDGGAGGLTEIAGVESGLAGIRRLAEALPEWGTREDACDLASYNGSCIEKFGNGGGNFRRLYAGFLEWARELDPDLVPPEAAPLAWQSADQWTALANLLWAASDGEDRWNEASAQAAKIVATETELFERLGNAL